MVARLTLLAAATHVVATTGCATTSASVETPRAPDEAPRTEQMASAYFASPKGAVAQIKALGVWTTLCNVPCEREVPIGSTYRLVQPGKEPAEGVLQGRAGERVTIAKAGESALSMIAVIGGSTMFAFGLVTAFYGALGNSVAQAFGGKGDGLTPYIYGGLVSAGVGAAFVTVGILDLASKPGLDIEPRPVPQAREAAWRSIDAIERHAPKPLALPILSGRF